MGPKKKGGKGKKGKKGPPDPEQVTTLKIVDDRTKMLCPRMGDVYFKTMQVEEILTDCVDRIFIKAADRQYKVLPLSGMKMNTFPDISSIAAELTNLVDVNLSKNQLFNVEQLFAGLALVKSIKKLNLSQNFLNGVVPETAGALDQLGTNPPQSYVCINTPPYPNRSALPACLPACRDPEPRRESAYRPVAAGSVLLESTEALLHSGQLRNGAARGAGGVEGGRAHKCEE